MVDKERRNKLAVYLRHLSVGLITNDKFEAAITEEVSYGWLPEQYFRSKNAKSDREDPSNYKTYAGIVLGPIR